MDQFPAGTRVVFWADSGKMKRGIVQVIRSVDGVLVAFVMVGPSTIKVPISSLSKDN